MEWPLGTAIGLALAGTLVAYGLVGGAYLTVRRDPRLGEQPDGFAGRALVVATLADVPLIFAVVATILVWNDPARAGQDRLLVVGVAALVTAVLQGVAGRQAVAATALDPSVYGRHLVRVIVPEVLVVTALVWFFLGL